MTKLTTLCLIAACILLIFTSGCKNGITGVNDADTTKFSDQCIVLDSAFFSLVPSDAILESVADSFTWSEGPVWVPALNAVLFSDVPENKIYKYAETDGLSLFLEPAGYTGTGDRPGELGSNGLTLDNEGNLLLCQHGDRRIASYKGDLNTPSPDFETIADNWKGKKFSSPNDLCVDKAGSVYFTDPPYGLPQQENDPDKEIAFQGVYKVNREGEVTLLVDSLTRPNGIALFPDQKSILIANSDPHKPCWYLYNIAEDGSLTNGSVFYSAAEYMGSQYPGLPDGLRIDSSGNVFASGPGGIWVFNNQGKHLGIVLTGQATSNCTFGADQKTLYITADMFLMRLRR